MHKLYKLKDTLVKELSDYGEEGGVTKANLEVIDKLAHAAKNVAKTIECCEKDDYSMAMGGGYSRRGGYSMRHYYDDGSYADGDYRAADGIRNYVRPDGSYSRRRGRDSMGRYSSEGGSVDEHTKEALMKLIKEM